MKERTKYLIIALLVFFSGIYIIAFGIYSVAYTHMWWTGLTLILTGILSMFLGLTGVFELQRDQPHGPYR